MCARVCVCVYIYTLHINIIDTQKISLLYDISLLYFLRCTSIHLVLINIFKDKDYLMISLISQYSHCINKYK